MEKNILIFLSLFLMYSCCPKDKQKEIPSNLIESWIPYQKGDKILYSNENNEVDSIEVDFVNSEFKTKGHWCAVDVEHIDINIKGNLFSYLNVNIEPNMLYFFLNVNNKSESYFYYFEDEKIVPNSETPNFYSEIMIGNINYNDVFALKNDSLTVYYGKNNGIIGYKMNENIFAKD